MVRSVIFLSLFLLFSSLISHAQSVQLSLCRIDSANSAPAVLLPNKYHKEQDLVQEVQNILPNLQAQGYLSASIDRIAISENLYQVFYFQGPQYRWAKLSLDSISQSLLIATNGSEQQFVNKPLNPNAIARLCEKLLQHCEENGYPFARLWLDNVHEVAPEKIEAVLKVDLAEKRIIDSIIINGDLNISSAFIHRYVDIAKGSVYDEKKLKAISQRIRELPFLQEQYPWAIQFRPGDTRLNLYLKEKKANQLNAILGLMPNNLQANQLLITADVQLALQNFLGQGESISASFQNLQVKSPRIKTDVVIPYLLKSPIGTELHFDFFSNNLQFRKISLQTGFRYQVSTTDLLRLYYQLLGTRILEIDTAGILATRQLPANIDARSSGVGLEWQSQHTDYRLNPRKGWQARLGLTAFQRKIMENSTISGLSDGSGFQYQSLYDTLIKMAYQYHFSADVAGYIPLGKNLCIKLAYSGAFIAAPRVFQNELFQIGGFKMLRGFDEQSIFANQYHIALVELRLRFSQNSFAYLFSDNGWVETKFNNYNRAAWHNGFGLGTTLETKTGLFSIAVAFGRSEQIPLRFRESKISFGYIALF